MRSKQLRVTARKRSFFVPNSWNTYGCETPTRRAIASVDAPTSPPVANSSVAAATIASRRSSAVIRGPRVPGERREGVVADIAANLALAKLDVKLNLAGQCASRRQLPARRVT